MSEPVHNYADTAMKSTIDIQQVSYTYLPIKQYFKIMSSA
jgi:hypothetical protein